MSSVRDVDFTRIRENIDRTGLHIYVVAGGPSPTFAYSIGLHQLLGFEIVMAGASAYRNEELVESVNAVAVELRKSLPHELYSSRFTAQQFSLRDVEQSWVKLLLLGALDFYGTKELRAVQIVPSDDRITRDVPDMRAPWNPQAEPAWRWLVESWNYPVPRGSTAGTNLDALRGQPITEAMRWEVDEWEAFAGSGPDTPAIDMRKVPLGTLLAMDASLEPLTKLPVGQGVWRDEDSGWHEWIVKGK